MSPLDATNALFIMGFIVLVSLRRYTASQCGEGCNISVTCLRYSANNNALDSWPIRAHLASQNDELCKNNNVQYVENNVFFFTLNHIKKLHYTKYPK